MLIFSVQPFKFHYDHSSLINQLIKPDSLIASKNKNPQSRAGILNYFKQGSKYIKVKIFEVWSLP